MASNRSGSSCLSGTDALRTSLPMSPRRSTWEFPLGFIVTPPKMVHLSTKAAAALNCAENASLLSGSSANGSDGPAH